MSVRTVILALALVAFSSVAPAQPDGYGQQGAYGQQGFGDGSARGFATADPQQQIRSRLQQSRPDLEIASIRVSRIPGMYQVVFTQGQKIYITEDGAHFILGDMYQVSPGGFTNLAEMERNKERATLLLQEPRSDMIVFSPKGATTGALYVFTDVDCGYCRKFHQEVPRLNELGIEVRYLAYPRSLSQQGEASPAFRKMASAWCAADRQSSLTALKALEPIESNVCEGNPVLRQFRLGTQMGVSGTPSIVTESGQLIPGYMTAERLAALIAGEQ